MHMMLLECTTKEIAENPKKSLEKFKSKQPFYTFLKESANFILMLPSSAKTTNNESTDIDINTLTKELKELLEEIEAKYKQREFIHVVVPSKEAKMVDFEKISLETPEKRYEMLLGKLTIGEFPVVLSPAIFQEKKQGPGGIAFPGGAGNPLNALLQNLIAGGSGAEGIGPPPPEQQMPLGFGSVIGGAPQQTQSFFGGSGVQIGGSPVGGTTGMG